MIVGTVTSKGQTTIPKVVRDELGLSEGSKIEWEIKDGKASVSARTNRRAIDLAGILRGPAGTSVTIDGMDDAIGRFLAEDDERISKEWHEDRT